MNTNQILTTDDASIFKQLDHNRPVVQSHVQSLIQSMSDKPHLFPARPILCNEKMQVVDGQHRLAAARHNKQTIYYMIVDGLTIDDARLLNALQRTWSLLDYAYSYASSGYQAYKDFVKEYESRTLPPSVIFAYMSASHVQKQRHYFRVGEFEPMDKAAYTTQLDQLEDLSENSKEWNSHRFSMAYLTLARNDKYEHERMMKKLGKQEITVRADRVDYIRELERIYNADVMLGGANYVRFF